MLTAFYDEEVIRIGDDRLTLAIDFRAIDIIEHLVGENGSITPMTEVLAMLATDPPPVSVLGKVFYALLQRRHETVTLDAAAGLLFGKYRDHVETAIYGLLMRAMNLGDQKAKDKNPRKRRGASAPS